MSRIWGFLSDYEQALRLGVQPGLVLLSKDFRKVAHSLHARGSCPMRTERGHHYSADPSLPGNLPVFDPDSLSDYQLCYWGVLDAHARQCQAEKIYAQEGVSEKILWTSAQDLHCFEQVEAMGKTFGLEFADRTAARKSHDEIKDLHFNPNAGSSRSSVANAARQEAVVLDWIGFFDPIFVEHLLQSPLMADDTAAHFQ